MELVLIILLILLLCGGGWGLHGGTFYGPNAAPWGGILGVILVIFLVMIIVSLFHPWGHAYPW